LALVFVDFAAAADVQDQYDVRGIDAVDHAVPEAAELRSNSSEPLGLLSFACFSGPMDAPWAKTSKACGPWR